MPSSSNIIDKAEQLLIEKNPEYFEKVDSSKRRMAITQALLLLPLPCRGAGVTSDLCNLRDDLVAMERGEIPERKKKVVENLVARVKKVLESNQKSKSCPK